MFLLPGLALSSLCTWLVLSLFLCPLLPLCSVAATQDCVTGTDKVVETLISLSFELPGHSSLFQLEARYGEGIPTSVPCKTSRSPGPAICSQCIEGSQLLQVVWHLCRWEGIMAGGRFERSICCCTLRVSSPALGLGLRFSGCCCSLWCQWQFGCCCQCQQKRSLERRMLTVPQAPGPEGSLGCLGGRELPLFLTLLTQSWAGHKWVSTANRQPVSLFHPCVLRFLTFELKLYEGNCFWSLCVSPC